MSLVGLLQVKRAKYKYFGGEEKVLGLGTLDLRFTDASNNKETKRVELWDPDTKKPAGEVTLRLCVKMVRFLCGTLTSLQDSQLSYVSNLMKRERERADG